jgi:hypothetical protein
MCERLIPIAAVLSPASLTSAVSTQTNSTTCTVTNINFTAESYNDFRHPKNISGFSGTSLSYYNTTDTNATTPGWFDYFDQPSKNAHRLVVMSIYSRKPIPRDNAALQSCGANWNCTYNVDFTGPGYKCEGLASGVDSNTTELAGLGAPFNTSSLAPAGINIYQAVVDEGDYLDPQLPIDSHGQLQQGPPWPEDLGIFKTEPILWIGYSVNTDEPLPKDSPYAGKWNTTMIPKIFSCKLYETQYSVQFNYAGGQQSTTVVKRTFLSPVINTSLVKFPNGTLNSSNILPPSNFIRPNKDVPLYKLTAAYHSVGSLFRNFLKGTIQGQHAEWPITFSDVSETRLIDQRNFYPIPDLQTQLQSLYEDLLLTLFSDPHLVIGSTATVPCTKSRNVILFNYHAQGLWVGYAIVIALALVFLIIGFAAMRDNGVASDTRFSRIMVTTRNPTLDRLSVGACLGNNIFPTDLSKTRLRFGALNEDDADQAGGFLEERVAHCAFGTETETESIVKGRMYAGLNTSKERNNRRAGRG